MEYAASMQAQSAIRRTWLTQGRRRGACGNVAKHGASTFHAAGGGNDSSGNSRRASACHSKRASGSSGSSASTSSSGTDAGMEKLKPVLVPDGSRYTWQRDDLAVVLVHPQIPQNSGNVARSCAATKVPLHLIAPSFELDDKKLKRAGLDYWDWVCIKPWESMEAFLEWYGGLESEKRMFAYSKFGKTHYARDGLYRRTTTDGVGARTNFLLFGAESTGLPESAHKAADEIVRVPMANFDHVRSLNLATSVGIGLFEALRQLDGPEFRPGESEFECDSRF
jgi:tRNA (cytidine/uridine-2'-O-)-methyltransferase